MPELRQDPTTKEWIIIAKERTKRPHEFHRPVSQRPKAEYEESCPFCLGNESRTPPEVLAYRQEERANSPGWTVRVFPNKYAALEPEGTTVRQVEADFFWKMDGVGYHEVIVETPLHNRFLPSMDWQEVQAILQAYRQRYLFLREDKRVRYILIFKNHGEAAGTSLAHPHSQLVATSVVPANLRRKYEEAGRYFDATGRCIHCDALEAELRAKRRVVMETERFVVYHPFASQTPFETWIVPRRYCPSFAQATNEEIADLSVVLKKTLGSLSAALNDPDYNYVVNSAPIAGEDEEYYLWHLQILPRLGRLAGFELGSGMRINPAQPEETARFIRELDS
ncbi:MAG: galactose-1-phosphate uridylyltransferase [Acidobacteriota bacterium]